MHITDKMVDIGIATEKLRSLLDLDYMDSIVLNKHNIYWESEHLFEHEKLHDLRMRITAIHDNLSSIYEILTRGRQDDC